jgi:GDPmannose 4,6-dehydratase
MPTAFITGITGQDGAYLSQFLLDKGYRVIGLARLSASSEAATWRLRWLGILDDVEIVGGDVTDLPSLLRIFQKYKLDEVYNLAAQSLVTVSWQQPLLTNSITALGAANVLEALRLSRSGARFYQASSSEMFGRSEEPKQSERSPFHPRSPYGAAKLHAHCLTMNYRESFGLHTTSGILFNHESPLRGIEFVTRKVTDGAARIKLGLARQLSLGRLDACRDYVPAMWLMLQQAQPDDYVIATGIVHSVQDLCRIAFSSVGLNYEDHVVNDATLLRPADIDVLCGNAAKAREVLGWRPTTSFETMIAEMVDIDLSRHRAQMTK